MNKDDIEHELLGAATIFVGILLATGTIHLVLDGKLTWATAAGFLALVTAATVVAYREGRTWHEHAGWDG